MAHAHAHHIASKKLLFSVFGGLVALTALTVITAEYVSLGSSLDIVLALLIAGAKAALVVTFFMALKYDNRVNTLVFALGTIFVVVFLSFTLFDTVFRGDLGNVDTMTAADREREEESLRAVEEQIDPAALRIAPADYATEEPADTSASGAAGATSDSTASDTSNAPSTTPPDSTTVTPAGGASADTSSSSGN